MTFGNQIIQRLGPHLIHGRLRSLLAAEETKGCLPDVAPHDVALEPHFRILNAAILDQPMPPGHAVPEESPSIKDLVRLQVWLSPEESFDWNRSERFLKQLACLSHRFGIEIMGNGARITFTLLAHRTDLPVVRAAFQGEFARSKCVPLESDPLAALPAGMWTDLHFDDYYPPAPYYDPFTRPEELKATPFESLLASMANLPDEAIGLYQCLLQPADPTHAWHHNVNFATDIVYALRLRPTGPGANRFSQETPTGDRHRMALELEAKAHNDKAFFFAAIRIAVLGAGNAGPDHLRSLTTCISLFQHGGRPLIAVPSTAYAALPRDVIRDLFVTGATRRPGFLVNSRELAGPAHLPILAAETRALLPVKTLDPLAPRPGQLCDGIRIGHYDDAGRPRLVCLPLDLWMHHVHIIGKPGMGKSTLLENCILQLYAQGIGVILIDPHGDLVRRILTLLPEDAIDRTIWFKPGDGRFIPRWNPIEPVPGQEIGRMADDFVAVLKTFVEGWGDRMAHHLRQGLAGLMELDTCTLQRLYVLLQYSTQEAREIRDTILGRVRNPVTRGFWDTEHGKYSHGDRVPAMHKLSKLLTDDRTALMLAQPRSAFSMREIMDQGKVLLADLTGLGHELRSVIGCLLFSLAYLNALSRADVAPDKRKPCVMVVDEAHLILPDSVELGLVECRKYCLGIAAAHHHLGQLPSEKLDAISSTRTTITFNVDSKDAAKLATGLRGRVQPQDLMDLEMRQAILRAGNEVVRIETLPRRAVPETNHADRIIEASRRRYYRPREELERLREQGTSEDPGPPPPPASQETAVGGEELYYDAF